MHPRSALSRPSPKRSVSCAGLDDLEDLLHGSDNARAHPNRKRHQSLNNDNNIAATSFAASSSPSERDYPPPPASYPGARRRPELSPFNEKNSASGSFQLVPSSASSFDPRYRQASSNQIQAIEHPDSDEQDNNYQEEHSHDFNNEFSGGNGSYGGAHEYKSSFSALSQEPQDVFEHRLRLDHDALSAKRFDHNVFLPPSHRSASECSPREEFLVQAFGPSGFKLHGGTSVSSNDELDGSFSDDSSNNNREHDSPGRSAELADADSELKMSFNELEADIRGAMHQHPQQQQQHASRLPELVEIPQHSFPSSSHGPFGLNRSAGFSRSNQDILRVPLSDQPQDTRSYLAEDQKQPRYFTREQQNHTPLSQDKSAQQSKGSGGVQTPTKWLRDEDERLRVAVARFGGKNWKMIAETLGNGRTDVQCLHRWNKVLKPGLIKGPWTPEEDRILTSLITRYGVGKIRWCDLALHLPGRIGKQCRERWCNHLDSRIRKGQWTPEEDDMVFRWQQKLGNKWSEIAKLLPGRTENAVKNRFNSAARRKWLMNQANKGSAGAQSTPVAHNPSQVSPHMQLQQQQNMLLQSPSGPQEGNVYNVGSIPYLGGKVTPLPSTGLFVAQREEHHAQTMIPPLGRQTLSQQYTLSPGALTTDALLASASDGSHSALRSSLSASQDHDKHPEVSKSELVTPPTFVPPPLNSLFHPPVINAAAGTTRTLHHLASSNEGANRPVFPLPAHLPTLLQHESSVAADPPAKDMSGDMAADKDANLALLQMKEEKAERDDLVLQAAGDLPAASDTSVPMDDENMNSFLDSVALELDDIME